MRDFELRFFDPRFRDGLRLFDLFGDERLLDAMIFIQKKKKIN
jgi:hypothetical protein